jgi:SAM-dependent methyltransferase
MTEIESVSWESAVERLRADDTQKELVKACFYDDPLYSAAKRFHASTEWQAVQRLLTSSRGRALDIGAGMGISTYALAKDGWAVTALEPDPSHVVGAGAIRSLMAESQLEAEIIETWGERLPFADNSFALVYCRQVLHHARDLSQLCREAVRVLAPKGILIAAREHVISRGQDLQAFLDGHPLHKLYGGENAYTLAEYQNALTGAGLIVDQILNPYESNINCYPQTLTDIKHRWARKLHLPSSKLIPDRLLRWTGELIDTPGRLYTFIGHKD